MARSYGLVGYLRVSDTAHTALGIHVCAVADISGSLQASLKEHRVTESKPDNTVEDLRFHQPWTELQRFADSIDLASADDITHKHVPYGGSALAHHIAATCFSHY